ncbi:hypothetical protein [Sandarakinorhabdus sp.]|uniref:hypothetical protein n=1 Tax=Sandarakinorhabdus sp. TaxID=1916663 RepID=UPI00333E7537
MPARNTLSKSAVLIALCLLAGCASPSQRITSKLVDLGMPKRQAVCMGDRLGQRLSVGQLRRLQQLSGIRADRLDRMTIREIASKLTDEKDPELIAELIRAGIGCAI